MTRQHTPHTQCKLSSIKGMGMSAEDITRQHTPHTQCYQNSRIFLMLFFFFFHTKMPTLEHIVFCLILKITIVHDSSLKIQDN